jgi:transposase-like protein
MKITFRRTPLNTSPKLKKITGSAPSNYWYHIPGTLSHSVFITFYLSSGIVLRMFRTRSSSAITCQNPACQFFQIEDGKDLVKNGKNCAGNQQYFCKHCQKYFAETKNTPLYNSRLPREDVEVICKHSVERTSSRGVAWVTGHHHQGTIIRYYQLIGEHAELLNERFQQSLSLGPIELDELWTFVRKNK